MQIVIVCIQPKLTEYIEDEKKVIYTCHDTEISSKKSKAAIIMERQTLQKI